MKIMKRLFITFVGLFFSLSFYSQNQKKIALVIGNSNYLDANSVLKNPVNDAHLMGNTFEKLEFDSVIVAIDLTYDQMRTAFSNYKRLLRNDYDVGFIYYSGHGTQDDYKSSYLIPIDFPKDPSIDDLELMGYNMSQFINSLERIDDKVNIIILDACRNNPFDKSWKGKSITSNGLSEPENPPNGVLIHYSTRAGYTASDNSDGNNSIYTSTLANVMQEPNLKIEEIFKKVRGIVRMETDSEQSPQLYGEFDGDLYLLLKKDYSKIEVNELKEDAKNDVENGEIASAIKKYQILQNYFESSMHNIDKNKLLHVYLDLGNIYWNMTENVTSREEYNDFRNRSSDSFFNATQLLEAEGVYSKEEKSIYSEALYKFLRVQAYIDFDLNDLGNNDSLMSLYDSEISKLIDFNVENFGEENYRTGSAYYLKGIVLKEYNPFTSLDALSKSSNIFFNSTYNKTDLIQYAFIDYIDIYSCKWRIIVLNDILSFAWKYLDTENDISDYIYEIAGNDLPNFKNDQTEIIRKAIDLSIKNDSIDIQGILETTNSFYDAFSLFAVNSKDASYTSENYIDDILTAEAYVDTLMSFQQHYTDSISFLRESARRFNNITLLPPPYGRYENEFSEFYYRSFQASINAFSTAAFHQNPIWEIYTAIPILEKYYWANDTDTLYSHDVVNAILTRIDKSMGDLMYDFEDNWGSYVAEYYKLTSELYYDKNKLSIEEFFNIQKQNLNTIFITDGYGSKKKVGSLLVTSTLLNDMGRYEEAKKMKLEAFAYINKHFANWTIDESDKFDDIDSFTTFYKSRLFQYYMEDISDNFLDKYPNVDFETVENANKFLETEKDKLKNLAQIDGYKGEYYSLKLPIIKAEIFLNWGQTDSVLQLCDDALSILRKLKKDQKFDDLNQLQIETLQEEFYNYKIYNYKTYTDKEPSALIEYNYDLIKTAETWTEKESISTIMETYNNISWHKWEQGDYKSSKKVAEKAFQIGENYLHEGDFSYWAYPKFKQKSLMLDMKQCLGMMTEHALNPTTELRKKTIEFTIAIIDFIEQNKNAEYVYDAKELYSLYNTISDQYHWLNSHDKSLEYNMKNLELVRSFPGDSIFINGEETVLLKWINERYCEEIQNDKEGLKFYKEYLNSVSYLNDTLDFTCELVQKNYGNCVVPFISIKMSINNTLYPCIEFDVDRNQKVSDFDKRYYVRSDTLIVENISTITKNIGGYKNSGIDKNGLQHDTTSYLFFDKENTISSNSYFLKREDSNNLENTIWEFIIPASELQYDDVSQINFIVNLVSNNPSFYTLSRVYDKHPFPAMSKFKEFESSYIEKLDFVE